VRWWLVIIFLLFGLVGIGLGSWIADERTWWIAEQAAYWSGVAVNVGSSLLLAAVLVWFERALLVRVEKQNAKVVENATAAATTAAEHAVSRATDELIPRLEEIDSRLRAQQSKTRSDQDRVVKTLGLEATRDAVLNAMSAASRINALRQASFIGSGVVVVPCGRDLNSPRVAARYRPANEHPDFIHPAALTLIYVEGSNGAEVEWDETSDDAAQALALLQREMVANGSGTASTRISAHAFFENLRNVLEDAIKAREGDTSAWLSGGRVFELVSDGCVITEKGVEFRDVGIPIQPRNFSLFGTASAGDARNIERPVSISEEVWDHAITRARTYFAKRQLN
jgi:hypothetical protein